MKRALMIAYHFPPMGGSSGIQRTLRFVQHLPTFGWQPLVLSAHPMAYERTATDLQQEVPAGIEVRRALALDTARHLSVFGRYPAFMARPDRWISWKFDAVRQGMQLLQKHRPEVIWSTYPIATAHMIGAELHRLSGIPWVADFRDPMAQDGYPADPLTWKQFEAIERHAVQTAAFSVFTTPGAAQVYRTRYPQAADRIVVLENGYDEESFLAAERAGQQRTPLNPGAITLLHSGIVYPSERDPTALFQALRYLKDQDGLQTSELQIRFRASANDSMLRQLSAEHGVQDFIETCPPLGYREALGEMLQADALLVLQASNCNEQIPAKMYEYLRAHKPIVCLSDPLGDTVGVLRAASLDTFAPLDDPIAVARLLTRVKADCLAGLYRLPEPSFVKSASRAGRAGALATLLGSIAPAVARAKS